MLSGRLFLLVFPAGRRLRKSVPRAGPATGLLLHPRRQQRSQKQKRASRRLAPPFPHTIVHRSTVCVSWFELRSNCVFHRKRGRARRAVANLQLPSATIGPLAAASALLSLLFFPCNNPLSEAQMMENLFFRERLRGSAQSGATQYGAHLDPELSSLFLADPFTPHRSSNCQQIICILGRWKGPFQRLPFKGTLRRPSRWR